MSEHHTVIFDLDGVLIDSFPLHYESWRRLALEHDHTLSEGDFQPWFGHTGAEMIRALTGVTDADEAAIERMATRKRDLFAELAEAGCTSIDGARQLIDDLLEAGFRLAIATAGPRRNLPYAMRALERADAFSIIVTADEVERSKPDPEVYLTTLRRLGAAADRTIVIEDSPVGISAAKAAGLTVIGLPGNGRAPTDLVEADLVVGSLRMLSPSSIEALLTQGQAAT